MPHTLYPKRISFIFFSGIGLMEALIHAIYLPAMEDIRSRLHLSSAWIEMTIPLSFLFFGLAPFIASPYSDEVNRKKTLMFALLINALGYAIGALAFHFSTLLISRIMVSLATTCCSVVADGILNDSNQSHQSSSVLAVMFVKMKNKVMMILSFVPFLGACLSEWCVEHYHFRWIFVFMFALNVMMLIVTQCYLPSHANQNGLTFGHFQIKAYWHRMYRRARSSVLSAWMIASALVLSAYWGAIDYYWSESFFYYEKVLHFPSHWYQFVFLFHSCFYLLTGALSNMLLNRFHFVQLLKGEWRVAFLMVWVFLSYLLFGFSNECSSWAHSVRFIIVNLLVGSIFIPLIMGIDQLRSLVVTRNPRHVTLAISVFHLIGNTVSCIFIFIAISTQSLGRDSIVSMPIYFICMMIFSAFFMRSLLKST